MKKKINLSKKVISNKIIKFLDFNKNIQNFKIMENDKIDSITLLHLSIYVEREFKLKFNPIDTANIFYDLDSLIAFIYEKKNL